MSIPETVEELSTDWLNSLSEEIAPGASVRSVELVNAHSGTTGRAQLQVTWSDASLPRSIFVKLPPTDPFQRTLAVDTGMGAREAHFYQTLAKEVPVRIPRPIFSQYKEDASAYIMLIEDLASAGCQFPDAGSNADLAVARSTVEGLAKLHAAFWNSPRFATDLDWVEPPMHSEFGPELVKAGVAQFGDSQPDAFHQIAPIYTEHGNELAELIARGNQTLLHGDCHLGNLFFENGTVGFLDWACLSKGPALRDVAYFLSSSVDTELRRNEQESLLRHYLAVLEDNGAPAPDFDEAWTDYRRFAVTGWISAVATYALGDAMQSLEVGRSAVARANATVEDLDTAELLRAELGL